VNFINEAVIGRSTFGIGDKVIDDTENITITAVTVVCSDYTTESECTNAGCFWWSDGTCHSTSEEEEEEIPWVLILGVAGAIIASIIVVIIARR
jgi:hypothetical protein